MKKFSKIIIISFLIEIFFFNIKFFISLFYNQEKDITNLVTINDVGNDKYQDRYYVSGDNPYIEFEVNDKLDNIYLDIHSGKKSKIKLSIEYTDDLNKYFEKSVIDEYQYTIINNIEKSKYISNGYVGNTYKVRINIGLDLYEPFSVDKIIINKTYPFEFNIIRYILLFLLISFIRFGFKDKIFLDVYNNNKQKIILWSIVSLFIALISYIYFNIGENKLYSDIYGINYVSAIKSGKLYINENEITGVDNLYDYSELKNKGIGYIFDGSYYKGKTYMYFGILPAIILILFNISVNMLYYILILLSIIFGVKLLKEIIYKYFPKTSFSILILLVLFYLFNFRLLLILNSIRFYELLSLFGHFLSVIGLYYVFKAIKDKINYKYLILGNIFLSLNLLVKTNMLIVVLIEIYLLYDYFKKYKYLNIKKIIISIIPYIVVLLVAMIINYIRFENVFEFGLSYQLTISSHKNIIGIEIRTIINGLFCYLFRFPIITTEFPYILNNTDIIYHNLFYFNNSCGNGIIPMSILGILLFYIPNIKNKKLFKTILVFLIVGILMIISSCSLGGTLDRYMIEFTFLILISIILITLYLYNENKINKYLLLIIVLISSFMNLFVAFDDKNVDRVTTYSEVGEKIIYTLKI